MTAVEYTRHPSRSRIVLTHRMQRYYHHIERIAWRHLRILGCCDTLLDAIGHVTREDERPVRYVHR